MGGIGAAGALVLAGLAAFHPRAGAPDWIAAVLFLFAVVVYVAQVRPAVVLGESDLVLRNMLGSVHVPWAAIKDAQVRQFLRVEVGRRTYDCAAVGRTRRQILKDSRQPGAAGPATWQPGTATPSGSQPGGATHAELSYGRFIETKIRNRAKEAMKKRGIEERSEEQDALAEGVHTVWAWPEIVLLAVALVALAVTIVV
jgi:hypothetical protein